jgi:hypothetical protein
VSFQFHPDARDEFREAVLSYDRTAERFVDAVETAIAAIIPGADVLFGDEKPASRLASLP